jgi:hypothetical protein
LPDLALFSFFPVRRRSCGEVLSRVNKNIDDALLCFHSNICPMILHQIFRCGELAGDVNEAIVFSRVHYLIDKGCKGADIFAYKNGLSFK